MTSQKPSILLFQGEEVPSSGLSVLTLPHPATPASAVLFCLANEQLFELQSVQPRKYGAWFIDERVSSDPSYLMATKFDPKFLLLPFLEKATRFSPIDQIVTYVEGCDRIPLQYHSKWGLEDICDVNDKLGDDMILYRLNQEKTMAWLKNKVEKTAAYMATKRMKALESHVSTFNVSGQSSGNNMAASSSETSIVSAEDRVVALSIICDFLSENMMQKLLEEYNVPKASIEKSSKAGRQKRKADWESALEVEKETLSYNSVVSSQKESLSSNNGMAKKGPVAPPKKKSSTNSKQAAPVKGAGSIMSFFGKKS